MAKVICTDETMPALYDQAVIIAECEIFLMKLRTARVAITERNSIINSMPEDASEICQDPKSIKEAVDAIRDLKAALAAAEEKNFGSAANDQSTALPRTTPPNAQWTSAFDTAPSRANERDAFLRALPNLVTLERYERRAMSRRNRAIRMFQAISLVAPFLGHEAKGR